MHNEHIDNSIVKNDFMFYYINILSYLIKIKTHLKYLF